MQAITSHTQDRWAVEDHGHGMIKVETPTRVICEMCGLTKNLPETMANARLIAAAPELLEALQALCDFTMTAHEPDTALKLFVALKRSGRIAIDKALSARPQG